MEMWKHMVSGVCYYRAELSVGSVCSLYGSWMCCTGCDKTLGQSKAADIGVASTLES